MTTYECQWGLQHNPSSFRLWLFIDEYLELGFFQANAMLMNYNVMYRSPIQVHQPSPMAGHSQTTALNTNLLDTVLYVTPVIRSVFSRTSVHTS